MNELDLRPLNPPTTVRRANLRRRLPAYLLAATLALAACGGDGSDGDDASDATTDRSVTSAETTEVTTSEPASTTEAPLELPELGPESAAGNNLPDGTYAALLNSVDAEMAELGLNLVTVSLQDGVPVATDEDPLGLINRRTNGDTEILLVPSDGGGLQPATQRELWNTMGKKDTGFAVGDSSVLFFTVEGGIITRIEQQPYIVLQ